MVWITYWSNFTAIITNHHHSERPNTLEFQSLPSSAIPFTFSTKTITMGHLLSRRSTMLWWWCYRNCCIHSLSRILHPETPLDALLLLSVVFQSISFPSRQELSATPRTLLTHVYVLYANEIFRSSGIFFINTRHQHEQCQRDHPSWRWRRLFRYLHCWTSILVLFQWTPLFVQF